MQMTSIKGKSTYLRKPKSTVFSTMTLQSLILISIGYILMIRICYSRKESDFMYTEFLKKIGLAKKNLVYNLMAEILRLTVPNWM